MQTPTPSAPPSEARLTLRCQFCQQWNRVDPARATDRPRCGSCGRFILLDRPWILHADSFQRTLDDSDLPVLVDFYADWCGPCKVMAPAVDELAARHQGKALVAKLNTDLAPEISQAHGVRGIPTTIVFEGGRELRRRSGAMPLAELERLLLGA